MHSFPITVVKFTQLIYCSEVPPAFYSYLYTYDYTKDTIKKTFDLSIKLCTAGWNTYGAMALPGSQLYKDALKNGSKLPDSYEGYSFHSYETQPLSTETLSAKEIISLRR